MQFLTLKYLKMQKKEEEKKHIFFLSFDNIRVLEGCRNAHYRTPRRCLKSKEGCILLLGRESSGVPRSDAYFLPTTNEHHQVSPPHHYQAEVEPALRQTSRVCSFLFRVAVVSETPPLQSTCGGLTPPLQSTCEGLSEAC